jgi:VanZ family protein
VLRRIWLALGWGWIALVSYLSLMPRPPEPVRFDNVDKVEHALAYAGLMLWFSQMGTRRLYLAAGFVAMGVGIEYLQRMTGFRQFDYWDMVADAVGVLLGGWGARGGLGRILVKLEAVREP